ncbi:glycosyltransferase [bacterium]|nr:glycosyltransferase [bacterium]MBU1984634.1 glycosyltransferase [bacterium]
MRIVLVGPAYPLRGGIAQYLAVLHVKLREAGHDVRFVSFTKQFPEWLFPGKTQFESSENVIDVNPVARFAPLGPRSWWRTYREIAAFDPDLVVFKWWMPFFGPGYWAVQRWVRKRTRARIAYIVDNVIPHERRPGDRALTKLAFSQTDYFIAQSRAVEKDLFTWFPRMPRERVAFSAHPIYDCYPAFPGSQKEARTTLGLPDDGKLILFFGFVRHYKGLDLLLKAMPAMRKALPDLRLVVAGEFYEPRSEFDKLIRELDLEGAVFIHDEYCPNEKVGAYFTACDTVVLPYRSATQSGIIQVCYALNTPVITTDVGGLAEVLVDGVTGLIVPPRNLDALTDAVQRFYAAGGRNAFREGVRREAGRFSWEGMVETIVRFGKS